MRGEERERDTTRASTCGTGRERRERERERERESERSLQVQCSRVSSEWGWPSAFSVLFFFRLFYFRYFVERKRRRRVWCAMMSCPAYPAGQSGRGRERERGGHGHFCCCHSLSPLPTNAANELCGEVHARLSIHSKRKSGH